MELKGTSAQDTREALNRPFEIELPDLNADRQENEKVKFLVRRVTVFDLISEGIKEIPNEFYTFVASLSSGNSDEVMSPEKRIENMRLVERFLDVCLLKGTINPPISRKYDPEKKETQVLFGEFTDKDQQILLHSLMGRRNVG